MTAHTEFQEGRCHVLCLIQDIKISCWLTLQIISMHDIYI